MSRQITCESGRAELLQVKANFYEGAIVAKKESAKVKSAKAAKTVKTEESKQVPQLAPELNEVRDTIRSRESSVDAALDDFATGISFLSAHIDVVASSERRSKRFANLVQNVMHVESKFDAAQQVILEAEQRESAIEQLAETGTYLFEMYGKDEALAAVVNLLVQIQAKPYEPEEVLSEGLRASGLPSELYSLGD